MNNKILLKQQEEPVLDDSELIQDSEQTEVNQDNYIAAKRINLFSDNDYEKVSENENQIAEDELEEQNIMSLRQKVIMKAENMLKTFNGRNSEFSNNYCLSNAVQSMPDQVVEQQNNNFASSKRFRKLTMMTNSHYQV